MTTVDNILACVEKAEASKAEVSALVTSFVKNLSYSHEDRWKVYSETPHYYFDRSEYIPDIYEVGNVSDVVDENYTENQTVDNVDLTTFFVDDGELYIIREHMMQSGIRRWKFDW